MHLHFSDKDDGLLIYCQQFPSVVVFACIEDHSKLAPPPGEWLHQTYAADIQQKIKEWVAANIPAAPPKPAGGEKE